MDTVRADFADELARNLQRERIQLVNQKLTREKDHGFSRAPGEEMKQLLAAQKPKQRQGASQANLERIAEAEERRLAREGGRNGQAQDQQQDQQTRQGREASQALSM